MRRNNLRTHHSFYVAEYFPPPRVEAWLTLPPGACIERDDPDWCPRSVGSTPRYPVVRPYKPFVDAFGHDAAVRWGLDWHTFTEIMKEVWTTPVMQELFYADNALFSRLGKS